MKKVLVVDDSETIRQQVASALERTEFAVVAAADGVEGLARAMEEEDLALVLLDVNMPRLNGIEMLEQLRLQPRTQQLPVLMLTTEVERSLMERAKKAGARAWLIKPINPELLRAAVVKLCA